MPVPGGNSFRCEREGVPESAAGGRKFSQLPEGPSNVCTVTSLFLSHCDAEEDCFVVPPRNAGFGQALAFHDCTDKGTSTCHGEERVPGGGGNHFSLSHLRACDCHGRQGSLAMTRNV